jgi:phenylpyruvate tautomerase PptA (4-oxalocrotonate tautomerase family)
VSADFDKEGNFMPLVRIDLVEGRSAPQVAAISNAIQRALVDCLDVPERDQFQVINEHSPGRLIYNSGYLGVERTEGIVIVQIFLSSGRSTAQKQAFYARAAELLAAEAATRPEDVTIVLTENTRADWSFGQGLAQYLALPQERWQ